MQVTNMARLNVDEAYVAWQSADPSRASVTEDVWRMCGSPSEQTVNSASGSKKRRLSSKELSTFDRLQQGNTTDAESLALFTQLLAECENNVPLSLPRVGSGEHGQAYNKVYHMCAHITCAHLLNSFTRVPLPSLCALP